ncbi:MAG: [FeFe] hydrogenase H-cluster maturation GTPase HydF [Treponemataceae bacterium]|nr:[FeFe] hydrogenase H-cluster maturation GTPase HydF [Treponemataceae bacterium]
MTETPRSERLHIGIFGSRNAGKSSLINALTGQNVSLVSDVAGTTTDPVYKAMELHGFGPVVFIDTPGLDDTGELGELRVKKTLEALEKTDVALFVLEPSAISAKKEGSPSAGKLTDEWLSRIKAKKIPIILVVNKIDQDKKSLDFAEPAPVDANAAALNGMDLLPVSAKTGTNIDKLRELIIKSAPESFMETTITGNLVQEGDLVLLVMPQDIQAPKGRLILPQVQTIRELLDKKCPVMSCTADTMDITLKCLSKPPALIITDSQAFKTVYPKVPEGSRLTSFSILFAAYKGDINAFMAGAEAFAKLKDGDRILVAEACTHPPTEEDIGREKIPNLIRKKIGEKILFDFVRGSDFPEDLSPYKLIIHCGACMFNRRHVMSRIAKASSQNVPICNYGVTLAYLTGILDKVVHP